MPHIHDKIDFTTQAFVVFKDKVLLRLHEKYGIWLAVGGHIELDEDPNQAVLREVKEEVGLDVELYDNREFKGYDVKRELIAPISVNRHHVNDTHEHVDLIFFAQYLRQSGTREGDRRVALVYFGRSWFNKLRPSNCILC